MELFQINKHKLIKSPSNTIFYEEFAKTNNQEVINEKKYKIYGVMQLLAS